MMYDSVLSHLIFAPDTVQSPGHAIPVLNIVIFQIKERVASDNVIFDSKSLCHLAVFDKP